MLYFKCICFTDNGNDIKAYRGINTEMFDVSISGYYNMAYFLPVNGILRFDVFCIAAGFLLPPQSSCPTLTATMSSSETIFPPITMTDGVSVTFQIRHRGFFSGLSESIVCCHTCIRPYF